MAIDASTDDVTISALDVADEPPAIQPLACPIAPFAPAFASNCPPVCAVFSGATVGALTYSSSTCGAETLVHAGEFVDITFPCGPETFDAGGQLVLAELEPYPPYVRFYGDLTNDGIFSACAATTFVGTDGCTWSTTQTITGPVPHSCSASGAGPFTFTYVEKAIAGTDCKPECTATAALTQ